MTKSRFAHSIALSQEEETHLQTLMAHKWTIMDIFRAGLKTIEGIVKKAKQIKD